MAQGGMTARRLASLVVMLLAMHVAPKAAAAFRNVHEGMEAPAFKLRDADGNEVSLDQYKKDKAVLVVFWATWSERSLSELSDIQKMMADLSPKGLKVLAINVDHEHMTDEDLKAIKAKLGAMKLSYPSLLDQGLDTYRTYGVVAVPSTAVLGEGGVVKAAFNGYPSFAYLEMKERSEILLGLRKPEEATTAAKAATGHKPAHQALLNYNLARRLAGSGMAEMAEPKLATAAKADPEWAAPRILLGDIYMAKARKDPSMAGRARKEYEAAVAAEKENVVARTALARLCWRTGALDDAAREIDEALRINAAYTPAMLVKAALLARAGRTPEAEKFMREAFALNPQDPESYALAGLAYEGAGDLAKAAAMYRKAWVLFGD